jgi:hypothetical protein
MEIAKLVVEFLRALAWPIVTLILVLRFHSALSQILTGLSDRFRTADKLKLGVMGQEVELSGTAQVLLHRKDELLRNADSEGGATVEAAQIQKSAQQLNNPIADIIGIALLRSRATGMTLEQIVQAIMVILAPKTEPAPFLLITMADQAKKCLDAMITAGLAEQRGQYAMLTDKGVDVFESVEKSQTSFLKRFRLLST